MASERDDKKINIIVVDEGNASPHTEEGIPDVTKSITDLERESFQRHLDQQQLDIPGAADLAGTGNPPLDAPKFADDLFQDNDPTSQAVQDLLNPADQVSSSAVDDLAEVDSESATDIFSQIAEDVSNIANYLGVGRNPIKSDEDAASGAEDDCCCCEEIIQGFTTANGWLEQIANTIGGSGNQGGGGSHGNMTAAAAALGPEAALAMQVFESIESIVEESWEVAKSIDRHIMSLADDIRQFSGDVILAETEAQIMQMEAMIRRSDAIGPELGEYIRSRGMLDAKITDLVTELESHFLPLASKGMTAIVLALTAMEAGLFGLIDMLPAEIRAAVRALLDDKTKEPDETLTDQILASWATRDAGLGGGMDFGANPFGP